MLNLKEFLGLNFYVSELDQFLKNYDQVNNKLSPAQKKEKEKYQRIYQLRDKPHVATTEKKIWDKF